MTTADFAEDVKLNDVTVIIDRSSAAGYLMCLLNQHEHDMPILVNQYDPLRERQNRARELLARQAMSTWLLHNNERDHCEPTHYLTKGKMELVAITKENGEGTFWTMTWTWDRYLGAHTVQYSRKLHIGLS